MVREMCQVDKKQQMTIENNGFFITLTFKLYFMVLKLCYCLLSNNVARLGVKIRHAIKSINH